jgi:hypothetical protein
MVIKWDKIKCTNYKLTKEKFETGEYITYIVGSLQQEILRKYK